MTVVCHRFVYKRRAENSDAPNSCLGLSLVEPMRLLDSVSDDCVINISKALSLFLCSCFCICHDMCMPLLFGLLCFQTLCLCVGAMICVSFVC